MICPHVLCLKDMTPDAVFNRDAAGYGWPQRRYYCASGHTKYDPPPLPVERPMCRVHTKIALPCGSCEQDAEEQLLRQRRRAASKAGRTNRDKHSGSIWKTLRWRREAFTRKVLAEVEEAC